MMDKFNQERINKHFQLYHMVNIKPLPKRNAFVYKIRAPGGLMLTWAKKLICIWQRLPVVRLEKMWNPTESTYL